MLGSMLISTLATFAVTSCSSVPASGGSDCAIGEHLAERRDDQFPRPEHLWGVLTEQASARASIAHDHDRPRVQAAPARGPIRIDGRLDEPDWEDAAATTNFTQLDPEEGRPASERTDVRVLIDNEALYVGALMADAEPHAIVSRLARRDYSRSDTDWFSVSIDAYHDHLTAVEFSVTPAGSVVDASIGADGSRDLSWDPVWASATHIDSRGWVAEIRIPLSQLRYTGQEDAVWGIQFTRRILRKQEIDLLAFTPKSGNADISRYGHLVGLGRVRAPRRLELLPYTSMRAEYTTVDPRSPFRDGRDVFGDAGFEVKYGVNSALTLDATVRPDFGQVEADPAVINLTDFEVRFDERRPFFVEGADQFRFARYRPSGGSDFPQLFFSRRIGRPPSRTLSSSRFRYADVPAQTTILGASKVSGKPRGWSVGILDAITDDEDAPYLDALGTRQTARVEPLANHLVARVSRELRSGDTAVGGLLTAVHRSLDDPALTSLLRSNAYVVGADLSHSWQRRTWVADAAVIGSTVHGSPEAITLVQRASARYFQRPDAPHLQLDPSRTALSGHAEQIGLTKLAGVHWRGSIGYQQVSPGFDSNDLGFQRYADFRRLALTLDYRENRPGRYLRSWRVIGRSRRGWDFGGTLVNNAVGMYGQTQFNNFWTVYGDISKDFETYDVRLTRGGPLATAPASMTYSLSVATDDRKAYQVNGSWSYFRASAGTRSWSTYIVTSVNTSPRVRVSVTPEVFGSHDVAQYTTRIADPTAASTYGQRYVFAALDQRTFALPTRVDWALSRRLSLQVFAQPFVGSGRYSDYAEFSAPRTFRFDVYGGDRGTIARDTSGAFSIDPDGSGPAPSFTLFDPGFNVRTVRTSLVLRWEYQPGSTVFVAFQRRREGEQALVVKATYWLGL